MIFIEPMHLTNKLVISNIVMFNKKRIRMFSQSLE